MLGFTHLELANRITLDDIYSTERLSSVVLPSRRRTLAARFWTITNNLRSNSFLTIHHSTTFHRRRRSKSSGKHSFVTWRSDGSSWPWLAHLPRLLPDGTSRQPGSGQKPPRSKALPVKSPSQNDKRTKASLGKKPRPVRSPPSSVKHA